MRLLRYVMRWLGILVLRGLWWLLRAPIALAINLVHFRTVRPMVGDAMDCATCQTPLALLGLWQCGGCGYSWHGWYWSRCEICGDVPPWVECGRCGSSTMNPLMFG